NLLRREVEGQMQDEAQAALDELQLDTRDEHYSVCLYDPEWHQGVLGILASRIKEKLHRPVIIFSRDYETTLRASARSIKGLHMRDALANIDAQYPGMLVRFGGHAMAAGLTLHESSFKRFTEAFEREVRRQLGPADLEEIIYSDGELEDAHFDIQLASQIRFFSPWGQGFSEPLFHGEFEVIQRRIVGEKHLKMTLRQVNGTKLIEAIAFHTTDEAWQHQTSRIQAAYKLDINYYMGRESLQLLIDYLEPIV
ncbi:MAG: single-stranded-DNA-specific exonuclease RecJ, partial [Gammaproteobacteria bacterium]|nr:single-stranded-DNA-specific exonuclease RecJ [Gammaproteobacteria bacterium]